LDTGEAYISENVKELENMKLFNIRYKRIEREHARFSTNIERIIISLKDEEPQPSKT
jgi:hypothetical protein